MGILHWYNGIFIHGNGPESCDDNFVAICGIGGGINHLRCCHWRQSCHLYNWTLVCSVTHIGNRKVVAVTFWCAGLHCSPFYWHCITLIPAWISNCVHYKTMWYYLSIPTFHWTKWGLVIRTYFSVSISLSTCWHLKTLWWERFPDYCFFVRTLVTMQWIPHTKGPVMWRLRYYEKPWRSCDVTKMNRRPVRHFVLKLPSFPFSLVRPWVVFVSQIGVFNFFVNSEFKFTKTWGGGYYANLLRSVIFRNFQHCQNTR